MDKFTNTELMVIYMTGTLDPKFDGTNDFGETIFNVIIYRKNELFYSIYLSLCDLCVYIVERVSYIKVAVLDV